MDPMLGNLWVPVVKGSKERDEKGKKKRKEAGSDGQEIPRERLANKEI